jgi:hypothetical protein
MATEFLVLILIKVKVYSSKVSPCKSKDGGLSEDTATQNNFETHMTTAELKV